MIDSAANIPSDHRDIIDCWPSLRAFSDDVGIDYESAKQMRRRRSIGDEYRPRVIEKAVERGISGVTFEVLTRLAPRRGQFKRPNKRKRRAA